MPIFKSTPLNFFSLFSLILLLASFALAMDEKTVEQQTTSTTSLLRSLFQHKLIIQQNLQNLENVLNTLRDQAGKLDSNLEDISLEENTALWRQERKKQKVRKIGLNNMFKLSLLFNLQADHYLALAGKQPSDSYLSRVYLKKFIQLDKRFSLKIERKLREFQSKEKSLFSQQLHLNRLRNKLLQLTGKMEYKKASKNRQLVKIKVREKLTRNRLDEIQKKLTPSKSRQQKIEMKPKSSIKNWHGRLTLPVEGETSITYEYNAMGVTPDNEIEAENPQVGIFIHFTGAQPVKAIYEGKIVFADKFSLLDKMIIIDHGQKYYSIYAMLSGFQKRRGDRVETGESIGFSVKEKNGVPSRIYFEFRENLLPLDPLPWFSR